MYNFVALSTAKSAFSSLFCTELTQWQKKRETETAGTVGSPALIPIWAPAVLPAAALSSVQILTK